jgi:hypothetical protein
MFMGTLIVGKPATIDFAADGANNGTTALAATWLGGDATVPDGPILVVDPATNQSADVVVPRCKLLQIDVHLPPGGHGTLTISQDGKIIAKPVTDDTSWVLVMVPA